MLLTVAAERGADPRHADLCQGCHGQDHHPGRRAGRRHPQREGEDPEQGRHPTEGATPDLCWQAA
eukprot:1392035-Lingulodinium_polyedra.AAC.1